MELMTDKAFYPAVSMWYLMPKLMGATRPLGWISIEDLGIIAAKVFASPDYFISQEINLASDVKSIDECRTIYRDVMGKQPPRFPMPIWLFKRFVGSDLLTMWSWLRTGEINFSTETTYSVHPNALTIEAWLYQLQKSPAH
jgi:hypothetical protein